MSKKEKKIEKQTMRGTQGFDLYYSQIFKERWQKLKQSLLVESNPVSYCIDKNCRTYFLDKASILAASALPLENAKSILDLCAAPGGKTLVLASLMSNDAHLTSNERSFERKLRLAKVCDEHLPLDVKQRIDITCSDGALWCKKKTQCFDRILLDAPCSSERHVLQDEKYLAQWSPARIKTLSLEQWALLSSAYRLLEPDGILVYSTCALAPKENDEVVERLLKKFSDSKVLFFDSDEYRLYQKNFENVVSKLQDYSLNLKIPQYEKTKYGQQILPDVQNGVGPIFFSIILKTKTRQIGDL